MLHDRGHLTGHWRPAVFLKRIKKRRDDKCWFCRGPRVTRSRALHERQTACSPRRGVGRQRSEKRPCPQQSSVGEGLLELSGVGRVVEGVDEEETRAARLDGWVVWEAEERVAL